MPQQHPNPIDEREIGSKNTLQALEMSVHRLKWIERHVSLPEAGPSFAMLDVGCSYGFFLEAVRLINHRIKLHGIEINPICAAECSTRIPGVDLSVQACQNKSPWDNEAMDVVTCFHVIEHLQNENEAQGLFAEVGRLLKPNGIFFLETPNCSWIGRRMFDLAKQSWVYGSTQHTLPMDLAKLRKLSSDELPITEHFFQYDRSGMYRRLQNYLHAGSWLSAAFRKRPVPSQA